ncbi:MAG: hypothetical protein F6J93_04780 [Oscillatoria sp. SIO1A7]|nr:hypothetical protein [Oscillatoria sp. SIO1A7]
MTTTIQQRELPISKIAAAFSPGFGATNTTAIQKILSWVSGVGPPSVSGVGCRVSGRHRCRVSGVGCRAAIGVGPPSVSGVGCRVSGVGCGVSGVGCGVSGYIKSG